MSVSDTESEQPALAALEQSACRRRGKTAMRVGLLAVSLTLTGCVHGPLSTLAPASDVTRAVAGLWWTMAVGAGVVLVLMVALAILAIRQNRPKGPGPRGVAMLLIGGGLILPTTVIVALLAFGLRLDNAQWPPGTRAEAGQAFHVDVIAHQWWWEVRYPERGRSVNVMHVPAGVPVHVRILSTDVIHGFWVPRIAGKLDAVPGRVNRIRLMVDEPGEYAGVCAEYCGDGHTHMQFTLVAHPPEALPGVLEMLEEDAQ